MLSGYYTIASGMLTRQRELDVIGNNLVNVSTPGYRTDRMLISSFEQELTRQEVNYTQGLSNTSATSAVADEVVSLFHDGTIKSTNRSLDVAISGDGFFNIQSDNGTLLTRNGQFEIDQQGYLTLPAIGRVLGANGPIQVRNENFTVDADGSVYNDQGNFLGAIQVTVPAEGAELLKLDNGLFQLANGAGGQAAQNYTVNQNNLELSNVDMNQEMTNLIEAQRAFQACSSALQIVDSMNRKAATQLASL
ncbi:flagellar hook-basal body protein [Scatolibacter rhodanostii]|uniref:flagellar hook-basal body protein n=1 Tax=Scatolibacter rhodanostii TaxID=2014781 RepID=UPI000C0779AB|nr:flagellar hook-basal body protein [Scatolibacter rhodanostii]